MKSDPQGWIPARGMLLYRLNHEPEGSEKP